MGVQLREQELESWMEWVEQQADPVIAAGDFNLTDQNAGYGLVAEQLNDAHRRAGWGWGHTWQAFRSEYAGLPLPSRLLRLDYVWYSDHWQVTDAWVGDWDGQSDHLPVFAILILR
jgi:endonuclease/exonuclease/phosphatase family metal-dependent hydrolase